jgi:hypothetical protein
MYKIWLHLQIWVTGHFFCYYGQADSKNDLLCTNIPTFPTMSNVFKSWNFVVLIHLSNNLIRWSWPLTKRWALFLELQKLNFNQELSITNWNIPCCMSIDFPCPNILHSLIALYYIVALCAKLGIYFQHIKVLDFFWGQIPHH